MTLTGPVILSSRNEFFLEKVMECGREGLPQGERQEVGALPLLGNGPRVLGFGRTQLDVSPSSSLPTSLPPGDQAGSHPSPLIPNAPPCSGTSPDHSRTPALPRAERQL